MKKRSLILSVVALLLLVTMGSCRKSFVGPVMVTHYYEVTPKMWIPTTDGAYYYATFNDADITANAIDNGIITAYYCNPVDANLTLDMPLPWVTYGEDSEGKLYEEQYSYDINPGQVTFKFSCNDFYFDDFLNNVPRMEFKVTVIQNGRYDL